MAVSAVSTTDRFYFTKEELQNTPSRKSGIDSEKEQSYRQQSATLIQDMGQRLSVSQLTINTAIVYVHRFYMFHSFTKFHRNSLAPCCLFLAAKVEEQPRKLEHVIRVAHACLHRDSPPLDPRSEEYMQQAQDLVENEAILLQTLGFEITVHHPHTYVVKCIQLVRASKDLGQTSYFMATNSLHLTTLCLQYKPSVVACACIHLASKWSNWEIPRSNDGKDWWEYIDSSVNKSLLDDIVQDFLKVMEKCPNRLKRKINSVTNLKGVVAHSKMPKIESSKGITGTNSTAAGSSSSSSLVAGHNNIDGAHNGYQTHDGTSFPNDLDGSTLQKKTDKEKEREKRKDSALGKLKPLPASSTVTSASGAASSSTTAMPPLPPLPPLTSKYATTTTTATQLPSIDGKVSSSLAHSTSGTLTVKDSASSRSKHRHHHSDESQPAKKHKSSHSQRPHSSHRKPGSSSQSSDSSPSVSVKHSHSSSHKSSSHSAKPSHHHSSQAVPGSSHSHSSSSLHSSKKTHPSLHHHSSSHKSSSHHGHSSANKPSLSSTQVLKKHPTPSKPAATLAPQLPTKPMTPPPPPPPLPSMDLDMLSSLNSSATCSFPGSSELQQSVVQFPTSFLASSYSASVSQRSSLVPPQSGFLGNPFSVSGIMQGMNSTVAPPPPPPEPSSPPPPPPPPLP